MSITGNGGGGVGAAPPQAGVRQGCSINYKVYHGIMASFELYCKAQTI